MRDGVFDHDGVSAPCIAAPHILPSALGDVLGLRDFKTFAAQYPTPHNRCVRFVAAVADEPRNTRYRAGADPYPDRTLTGWIRSAYPDAPPRFWTVSCARRSTVDVNTRRKDLLRDGGGYPDPRSADLIDAFGIASVPR
jgi:hypothetical protein